MNRAFRRENALTSDIDISELPAGSDWLCVEKVHNLKVSARDCMSMEAKDDSKALSSFDTAQRIDISWISYEVELPATTASPASAIVSSNCNPPLSLNGKYFPQFKIPKSGAKLNIA